MRPNHMTPEQYDAHVAESKAETKRRSDIEANPTDVALDHEARLQAIEAHVFGADQVDDDEEPADQVDDDEEPAEEAAPTPPPPPPTAPKKPAAAKRVRR